MGARTINVDLAGLERIDRTCALGAQGSKKIAQTQSGSSHQELEAPAARAHPGIESTHAARTAPKQFLTIFMV
jgi:hypothetical protein